MKALAARRRHPAAGAVLLLLALLLTGGLYAAAAPGQANASADAVSVDDIEEGQRLYLANCATCHGINAAGGREANGLISGPSLIGVGAASVDFQVGTGRMPLQASGPQAPDKTNRFSPEQVQQLAAYVGSLGVGPHIPDERYLDPAGGDPSIGGELFRVNCAMCHNAVGSGGALTGGKWAPALTDVAPVYIYEAMTTGPQSMPVFSDANITPQEKQDIIAYLAEVSDNPSPGGLDLGAIGPVAEGLFVFTVGLGALIACAVWLGSKSS